MSTSSRVARVLWLSSGVLLGACTSNTSKAPEEPEFDHGLKKPLVRKLREELEATPCDKAKARELSQVLLDSGDFKGLSRTAQAFTAKCGADEVLLQKAYTANARQGDAAQALKDATALVDAFPKNAGYRVWKGLTQQQLGQREAAAAEFAQAQALAPGERRILDATVKAYQDLGSACDVLAAYERHLAAKPSAADVKQAMQELAMKTSCPAPALEDGGAGAAAAPAP